MQINVTARHMDITEPIRAYAVERLEHELSDFPRVLHVRVILNVEKYRHIAEVIVQAKNHIHVEAQEESEDMYVSIDGAVNKAAKQLRRLRDKVQDHKSRETLAQVEQATQSAAAQEEDLYP